MCALLASEEGHTSLPEGMACRRGGHGLSLPSALLPRLSLVAAPPILDAHISRILQHYVDAPAVPAAAACRASPAAYPRPATGMFTHAASLRTARVLV